MKHPPSELQKRIFDWVCHGEGSAIISATAGSGKTTTIVESLKYVPPGKRVLLLAFNKGIVETLTRKVNDDEVFIKTFNALGYGAWRSVYPGTELDPKKVWSIIDSVINDDSERRKYGASVKRLVGLAKAEGFTDKNTEKDWISLIDLHDLGNDLDIPNLIILSVSVLARSTESAVGLKQGSNDATLSLGDDERVVLHKNVIDFDDQQYMPVLLGLQFRKFDFIFTDEAQDVNRIQREIIRRSLAPNGRLCAVGDERQAIYGWRGSGTDSIKEIEREFNAARLPLSISYRCPLAVVAEARKVFPDVPSDKLDLIIQSAPGALPGAVTGIGGYSHETFQPQDAILCRNNAPIFTLAYSLLRAGVTVKINGKEEIGKGLKAVIKRVTRNPDEELTEFAEKLSDFATRELKRLEAGKRYEAADRFNDKIETIEMLAGRLDSRQRTVAALVNAIDELSEDAPNAVLLSTIHRAKGLEFDRVYILDSFRIPSRYAVQPWMKEQERNLLFVAITRSKSSLTYIDLDGFVPEEETPEQAEMFNSEQLR